jgi:putative membrane protein
VSRAWLLVPVLGVGAIIALVALSFFYGAHVVGVYPWSGWWFPFGWFIFIPVIFLVFFAFRWIFRGRWWGGGWYYRQYGDPALEILKERFARGEITKDQFEQMAKDLEEH